MMDFDHADLIIQIKPMSYQKFNGKKWLYTSSFVNNLSKEMSVGLTDKSNKREASRQAQTVAKLGYHTKTSQEKSHVGQPQTLSYHNRDDFE